MRSRLVLPAIDSPFVIDVVFAGETAEPPWSKTAWKSLHAALTPLIALMPKAVQVQVGQLDIDKMKEVRFGKIGLDEASTRKWVHTAATPEAWRFVALDIYCPADRVRRAQNAAPVLFISLRSTFLNFGAGAPYLCVALARHWLEQSAVAAAHTAALAGAKEILDSPLTGRTERPWGTRLGPGVLDPLDTTRLLDFPDPKEAQGRPGYLTPSLQWIVDQRASR